jgi:ketosteroid isomerase-like protein
MKIFPNLIIGLLLLSCHSEAGKPLPDDESAIDQVYDLFSRAYRELDISLIDSIYQVDAIYLNPGDAIQFGKTSFIGSFQSMFETSKTDSSSLDIRFCIVDRQISKDQVVDIGYFNLTRSKDGQAAGSSVGKFITVLKKQPDGHWKFIADGYSQAPMEAWK